MKIIPWPLVMLLTFGIGTLSPSGSRLLKAGYEQAVRKSREVQLRSDLFRLRSLIREYSGAQGSPPESLDDLVFAGYISEVPKDPFTKVPYRGIVYVAQMRCIEDPCASRPATVVSESDEISTEGSRYSVW
jgi:hypothetical protein